MQYQRFTEGVCSGLGEVKSEGPILSAPLTSEASFHVYSSRCFL
jgi:hypothetical protein